MGEEDPCTDHIISSRASYRGMMYDHQYLLDDFETFKDNFFNAHPDTLYSKTLTGKAT